MPLVYICEILYPLLPVCETSVWNTFPCVSASPWGLNFCQVLRNLYRSFRDIGRKGVESEGWRNTKIKFLQYIKDVNKKNLVKSQRRIFAIDIVCKRGVIGGCLLSVVHLWKSERTKDQASKGDGRKQYGYEHTVNFTFFLQFDRNW
jgi:hypothetical protein